MRGPNFFGGIMKRLIIIFTITVWILSHVGLVLGSPSGKTGSAEAMVSMEKNGHAFLFVLEYALGAPLNQTQEKMVLNELLAGWQSQSPESLAKFDQYPQLVVLILSLGQQDLEKLRLELEKSTREWLAQSAQTDPVVQIVRQQLEQKSKVWVANTPPLTEMVATAYAEMTAFADALVANPNASTADIPEAAVDTIRGLLKDNWNTFSMAQRKDVLTCPGLWITFRTLFQFGSAAEKEKIRLQFSRLVSPLSKPTVPGNPAKPTSMVNHNVLMNLNQMTFNSYLWSRGFKTTRFGY
jgi:hypothetical protein